MIQTQIELVNKKELKTDSRKLFKNSYYKSAATAQYQRKSHRPHTNRCDRIAQQ